MARSETTAILVRFGTAVLSTSIHLPLNSGKSRNTPVMLPPGRAKLAMNPDAVGSDSRSIATIGMDFVACAAALTPAGDTAKIASTFERTSSRQSASISLVVPGRTRNSIVRLVPSINPFARRACRNGSKSCRNSKPSGAGRNTPIRTPLLACASAGRGAEEAPTVKIKASATIRTVTATLSTACLLIVCSHVRRTPRSAAAGEQREPAVRWSVKFDTSLMPTDIMIVDCQ
jgi:hypothetical protein